MTNSNFLPNQHSLIFMGTSEFASIILDKLIAADWTPKAVITQPDKPTGRKQILKPSPVKQLAEKHDIPVWQPEKLKNNRDIFEKIKTINPGLMIVAAYGKIIPKEILDIPTFGCLNVHPSLLPKYRGASPIQYAILNGDEETGATIMLMDEAMDHGAIIANSKFKVKSSKVTYEELSKDLAELGGNLLTEILPKWLNHKIKAVPQNDAEATYTKIIKKEDGLIDWSKSAEKIEGQIRAFHGWPNAFTKINLGGQAKILKIFRAEILKTGAEDNKSGQIFLNDKKITIACDKNYLMLEEIQLEGKNRMGGEDFARGYPQLVGTIIK